MRIQTDKHTTRSMLRKDPAPSTTDPDQWLTRHGDALWRFAMARLGNPAAVEEIIQETLLAALESRHSFRAESSERTWLIAILRRKIADFIRSSGRHQPAQLLPPAQTQNPYDDRGCWRTPPSPWPWSRSDPGADPEFWAAFESCLAKVPPGLAETFILREVRCLSPEAVCRALGITPENLWVRLHRAREALRRCLAAGDARARRGDR